MPVDDNSKRLLVRTGLSEELFFKELDRIAAEQEVSGDDVARYLDGFAKEECAEKGAEDSLVAHETEVARFVVCNAFRQANPTTAVAGSARNRPQEIAPRTPAVKKVAARKSVTGLSGGTGELESMLDSKHPLLQRIEAFIASLPQI